MKLLIIIPTYNECENIKTLLEELLRLSLSLEVLVIDDHSPDGTALVIKKMMAQDARIHLIEREGKMGLGSAYITGFKWALSRDYTAVLEMDADFSHQPKYIPEIWRRLSDYDMVVGSRWIKDGGTQDWGLYRSLLSQSANLYSRIILNVPIADLTGGFTAYRRTVLESLNLDTIRSNGYSFQIEMKYRTIKNGYHFVEIPILFPDRQKGNSKISRKIVFEALWMVWKLKFSHIKN